MHNPRKTKACLTLTLWLASLLWPGLATAGNDPVHITGTGAGTGVLDNAAEFGTFADNLITAEMARDGIPGAVLVVVKDGRVFYEQGYGYANVEHQIPWDPEQTILRAKSISKLVTATAIMQLYEQGRLKLDGDINQYLSTYQVPPTFPEPVTAANLLTHTGGFVDRGIATDAKNAADLEPLQQYLAAGRYYRRYPPGKYSSYGDHGPTILAAAAEQITGEAFPQYAADHIFTPLQMTHTTFQQPYPADLAQNLATGYIDLFGHYLPQEGGYSDVYPAGGLLTTAADMGHFMIAHLDGGRYGNGQILKPETLQLMHAQHFTQNPAVSGIAYGFWEDVTHGRRNLMHMGEGLGFGSWLYLLPGEDTGFFIATNRRDFRLHEAFTAAFLDRYFPAATAKHPVPASVGAPASWTPGAKDAARFPGVYQFLRFDPRTIEKVNVEQVIIRENGDGTLSASGIGGRWAEVAPLVFQRLDGEGRMAFEADDHGNITALFTDHWPWAYQKAHWYDAKPVWLGLLGASLLVFASFLALLPFWKRRTASQEPWLARLAWQAAVADAFLNLLFIGLLAPTLVIDSQGGDVSMLYGLSPLLRGTLTLPALTSLLTLVLAVMAVSAWWRRYWSLPRRVYFTLVTMSAGVFTWVAAYLNMLGVHI